MALSPSGLVLAAVHFSGALSLWDLPSLRSKAVWNEADQVNIKKNLYLKTTKVYHGKL